MFNKIGDMNVKIIIIKLNSLYVCTIKKTLR